MLTRARRARIPVLPLECWELVARHVSGVGLARMRGLSRELRDALPAPSVADLCDVYIVAHGRICLRASRSEGRWTVVCVDAHANDGAAYASRPVRHLWVESSCRVPWLSCGPYKVRVILNRFGFQWEIVTYAFYYRWHVARPLRQHLAVLYLPGGVDAVG